MEILAPCGGPEHVKAAIYAGADAVYLGGHGFSARRNAVNFSLEDLREAARFCRGYGVKLYVAVNILTRDTEWDELRAYLCELAAIPPDALIVQDIGVARLCRSMLPDMPLHASTQLSIHSPDGMRFCQETGLFSRVVVGRECDERTLARIIKCSDMGVEVFVHGALCVSVSGQCRLSAVIGGRSGNRGLCAQPCRLDFSDGKHNYALSLKDLSLIRQIPRLREMGVESLKIEGRMKRPEYVAAVVKACRAALDGGDAELEDLRAVFSRGGFTQGYFSGVHDDMGGVRSREDVEDTASILPRIREQMRVPARRVPVKIDFIAAHGRDCELRITDGTDTAAVKGAKPLVAVSRGLVPDEVSKLLMRMGSTPFAACRENVGVSLEPGLSIAASAINALRREACDKLLELRVKRLTPRCTLNAEQGSFRQKLTNTTELKKPFLRVHCGTIEQARAVMDAAAQITLSIENSEAALQSGLIDTQKLIVEPDSFIRDESKLSAKLSALREMGASHLLCCNPAHVFTGRAQGFTLHGGMELNVFNSESAAFFHEYGLRDLTASMELRLSECLALGGDTPVGLTAYGRLPLMLLRRCPLERKCERTGKRKCELYDRTGRRFPIRCNGIWRELLNSDTLWMADKLSSLSGFTFLSLLLFDESPGQAEEIVCAYKTGGAPPANHTRGLLFRGVE